MCRTTITHPTRLGPLVKSAVQTYTNVRTSTLPLQDSRLTLLTREVLLNMLTLSPPLHSSRMSDKDPGRKR